ncbi:MAG: hypothetical protein ACRC9S_01350 [Vibrio sp.]
MCVTDENMPFVATLLAPQRHDNRFFHDFNAGQGNSGEHFICDVLRYQSSRRLDEA